MSPISPIGAQTAGSLSASRRALLDQLERAKNPKPAAGLVDTDIAGIDVVVGDVLVSALNHKTPMFIDEISRAYVRLRDEFKRSTDDSLTLLHVKIVSTKS